MSLERYEEVVASNFDKLMNDNEKKTSGNYTTEDNAVLIRFRVRCFNQQKRSNSKKTSQVKRAKRQQDSFSKQPSKQSKRSIGTPPPGAMSQDSPGFLNLLAIQAQREFPAASDPATRRLGLLKFATGGRNADTSTYPKNVTNSTLH